MTQLLHRLNGGLGVATVSGRMSTRPRAGVLAVAVVAVLATGCSDSADPTIEPGAVPESATALQERLEAEQAQQTDSLGARDAAPTTQGPSKPVAAPEGGDITTQVDAGELKTLAPVDIDELVSVDGGVDVEVVETTVVEVEARQAGEIGGSAIAATIRITNTSREPLSLGGVTVSAQDDDHTPLLPLGGDPAEPLEGSLASGASTDAVYVFSLIDDVGDVEISVNPAPHLPVAVFRGSTN